MQKFDLHVHSVFSDGKSTPEEIVLSAIEKGLEKIGLSDHSHTPCDLSYCMKEDRYAEYRRVLAELKEKYAGRIEVLCGIEQDLYSSVSADGFDYSIGSVHYLRIEDEVFAVDGDPKELVRAAERYFKGDFMKVAELYYEEVAKLPEVTHADVIGHFDLITKYNEKEPFFSENDPRYVAAWKKAVDALLPYGIPFEINFGAISRGARLTPYPAKAIRDYIREHGGTFILSSDSHHADTVAFGFDGEGV